VWSGPANFRLPIVDCRLAIRRSTLRQSKIDNRKHVLSAANGSAMESNRQSTIENRQLKIRLRVNGESKQWTIAPGDLLLDVLRREAYWGVKRGCETGECGACTVLANGKPINSCLMFAAQADGCEILTIEGVAQGDALDPVQEAFLEHGAVQCGFCTPGMILNTKALLARRPNPTEEEVRDMLAGNYCRCTGYHKVVEAVLAAAANVERPNVPVAPPFRARPERSEGAARAGLKPGATAANGRGGARRKKSARRAGAKSR